MSIREEALRYHAQNPPGKIEIRSTKPTLTQHDLALAYSPGVAEPCREIHKDPEKVFEYTARGNLVAVVSNGTAVLGLGDIGPAAGKPVMEGKGVLFKRFAGIDVFDIELDAPDVDSFCNTVRAMAPTFGGINIEDVKAPDCFLIEERLRAELDIPVFHDDQHGTAIIICAGLINALHLADKKVEDVRIVFSGAGASAIATGKLLMGMGAKRENMLMCDSRGVIHEGDPRIASNPYKQLFAAKTDKQSLADALEGADVFIGLSVAGMVDKAMVKSMAKTPIVFALANPDPEIAYPDARAARDDAIVATGRSDYPNQVNNVLGFPFIFRGALDARVRTVNEPMMRAAVQALADLAREDVEDSVAAAYGGVNLRFGPEYIIPKPFDPRVLLHVAPAVALAATMSGVARKPINDIDAYRAHLEKYLGQERQVMRFAMNRARARPQRVVFADGEHRQVLRAVQHVLEDQIARPILVGRPDRIAKTIREHGIKLEVDRLEIHDPMHSALREDFVSLIHARRGRKGMTRADARRVMGQPTWFGSMMVREGHADGLVCGLGGNFPETLKPVLRVIGTAPECARVAGVHFMVIDDEPFLFADTTITLDPTAEQMAEVALLTADLARLFDLRPRVAMLSFSNFGSVDNERSQKVRRATELLRTWRPDIEVEGEMHADVALLPDVSSSHYPFSRLAGKANVLVFPSLEAGNIAQKIAQCTAAQATVGPVLVGLDRPVNILPHYADSQEVVLSAAITAMMAGDRVEKRQGNTGDDDLLRLVRRGRRAGAAEHAASGEDGAS